MTRLCLLVAGMILVATSAAAQHDPWLGRDKALHAAAGAAFGMGGYALGAVVFDTRERRVLVGITMGLGAGAAKELRDRSSAGTASWRDFTWTAAGTAVGVTAAWLIDRGRQRAGTGASAPPDGSSQRFDAAARPPVATTLTRSREPIGQEGHGAVRGFRGSESSSD
jgi:uncharacterized protein YfiM (DUF2279 family)